MIETAIHLLIGFLLAALLALMAMPAISRRSFRLAERRARMLAPLSATQAKADRDALRGQHAIETLVNLRRHESAETAAALAQIELGRSAREIAKRENEILEKSTEIARQRGEIADLGRDLLEREVEIASREMVLRDLAHQRDAAERRSAEAQTRIEEQGLNLERRRAEVASLELRISELSSALTERQRAFDTTALESTVILNGLSEKLAKAQAVASRLESQVHEFEGKNTALRSDSEGRAAESTRLRQRLGDLESRLSESERLRGELTIANARQMTRISEREAEAFRMKTEQREEIERFQDRLSGSVARENELTMRIQALIAARVEAENALRAVTADVANYRERLANAERIAASAANGDAALRRSIARLGRDLAERPSAYLGQSDEQLFPSRGRHEMTASIAGNNDEGPSPVGTDR